MCVHLSLPDLITVAGSSGRRLIQARPTPGAKVNSMKRSGKRQFSKYLGYCFIRKRMNGCQTLKRKISTMGSFHDFPN